VALLSRRPIETLPIKATRRAFGTAIGVTIAGFFVAYRPPDWAVIGGIGLLAGTRPFLKAGNYLAYSMIMTPLVILILDAGQPPGMGVMIDRLVATLLGATLVITANVVFGTLLAKTA